MIQKQLRNGNLKVFFAVVGMMLAALACKFPGQKEDTTPTMGYNPKPGSTAVPYGTGVLVVTERSDLDPITEGSQTGVSINFTLSVQDPEAIQYQYFEITGNSGPVYILSGYETPIGEVVISDFSNPTVSFTKEGENYVCPPVDPVDPFVVDCSGVLSVLLSN